MLSKLNYHSKRKNQVHFILSSTQPFASAICPVANIVPSNAGNLADSFEWRVRFRHAPRNVGANVSGALHVAKSKVGFNRALFGPGQGAPLPYRKKADKAK